MRDEAGEYIETGASAKLNGSEDTIVGYEGQVYIENAASSNTLSVQQSNGENCTVTFNAPATASGRTTIPDAVCRKDQ
ncbi:hypothetical protein HGG75_14995 [Ochrobactrum pseudogrignonense]|nr:hypothetical protein [Brucella pseudogrignonensis]